MKVATTRSAIGAVVFVVIVIGVAGNFHITCGGQGGTQFCSKESWGLSDTFVDLDEYVGVPAIALVPKAKVVRALVRCKILTLPGITEPLPITEYLDRLDVWFAAKGALGAKVSQHAMTITVRVNEHGDCNKGREIPRENGGMPSGYVLECEEPGTMFGSSTVWTASNGIVKNSQ